MKCEELMHTDVEVAYPEQTIHEVAQKMRDKNIGFLPVCDHTKQVLGAITDRDIATRVVAEGKPPEITVSDAMTREVVSCKPSDELSVAEQKMAEHKKSRIVCLDDEGKLAGVISLSDIAQCGDELEAARTLRDVSSREYASQIQA